MNTEKFLKFYPESDFIPKLGKIILKYFRINSMNFINISKIKKDFEKNFLGDSAIIAKTEKIFAKPRSKKRKKLFFSVGHRVGVCISTLPTYFMSYFLMMYLIQCTTLRTSPYPCFSYALWFTTGIAKIIILFIRSQTIYTTVNT